MALAASWPSTFEQVSALDDYRTLLPAVMWSLVRLDTLCVSSETVVIEAVARWADNDAPNREATYAEMFADPDAVRLSQLTVDELEALHTSPRVGHEGLVHERIGAEFIRRFSRREDLSRPRRYTSLQPELSAVPTAVERTS